MEGMSDLGAGLLSHLAVNTLQRWTIPLALEQPARRGCQVQAHARTLAAHSVWPVVSLSCGTIPLGEGGQKVCECAPWLGIPWKLLLPKATNRARLCQISASELTVHLDAVESGGASTCLVGPEAA